MKGKKLIAFLLAIFMLASVVPTAVVGASAADALADFEVTFTDAFDTSVGGNQKAEGNLDLYGWETNKDMTVAAYCADYNYDKVANDGNQMRLCNVWLDARMGAKNVPNDLTFNVKAPKAGTYMFSLGTILISSGPEVAIFVNEEYVGTFNARSGAPASGYSDATIPLKKVWLNEGANTITFSRIGGNSQLLLKKFIFTEGVADASYGFDKAVINPEKLSINVGDTMTVKGGVLMTNGTYKYMNGAAFTGVGSVYLWESAVQKNVCNLTSSDTTVATVAAVGAINAGELTYTFTALKPGRTNLTLNTKVNGENKTVSKIVEVIDPDTIGKEFSVTLTDAWNAGVGGNQKVEADLDTYGWEINKDMTVAAYCGEYNYDKVANDGNQMRMCNIWLDARMGAKNVPNDLTFNVKAPRAGTYLFSLEAVHISSGPEVAVFVNEEYVGTLNTRSGSIPSNPGYIAITTPFKKVWLNEGANTITFSRIGGNSQFLLKKFIFTEGVADESYGYDKTVLNVEKTVLNVGDTMTVKGGVLMTNGTYKYMNGAAFTGVGSVYLWESAVQKNVCNLTSTDATVASVAAVGAINAGEVTYSVTALKPGITNLFLNTKVNGEDKTVRKFIEVVDPSAPVENGFSIEFAREWIKAGGTGGNALAIPATLEEYGWQINQPMSNANYYGAGNGTAVNQGNTVRMQNNGLDLRMKTVKQGASLQDDFTIDVNAPEAGAYAFSISALHHSAGNEVAVFVNKEYAGFVNTKSGTGTITTELHNVQLSEGANTITFRQVGGTQLILQKIGFEKIDEVATFEEIYLAADKLTLELGESVKVYDGALMSDGSYKFVNGYKYGINDDPGKDSGNVNRGLVSSNAEVVSIAQGGTMNGMATSTITANAYGESEISVTYIIDGEEYTKSIIVNVPDPNPAPKYEQGDVNGDGKLNTRDVTTLRRYLAGGYEDSITFIPEMVDVNGDGRENTRDVAALRAIIAG